MPRRCAAALNVVKRPFARLNVLLSGLNDEWKS
jgi:hypothetical protein